VRLDSGRGKTDILSPQRLPVATNRRRAPHPPAQPPETRFCAAGRARPVRRMQKPPVPCRLPRTRPSVLTVQQSRRESPRLPPEAARARGYESSSADYVRHAPVTRITISISCFRKLHDTLTPPGWDLGWNSTWLTPHYRAVPPQPAERLPESGCKKERNGYRILLGKPRSRPGGCPGRGSDWVALQFWRSPHVRHPHRPV